MKFSGKMYLKIILKLTKNQGFTLSLEDKFFEKPQGGSNWPPSRFRVKRGEHIPCGYSMSTIWVFYHIENKHTLYRRKNCMKKFYSSLREHEKNVIDFEKIKMLPLTKKKTKITKDAKVCHICRKIILKKLAKSKNYQKIKDHCHYWGAAHSIFNLKFNVLNAIPVVFHNGSNYDLS